MILERFRDAVRQVAPLQFYRDEKHRDSVLEAIIFALEDLYDEVEELEEMEEEEEEEYEEEEAAEQEEQEA